MDTRLLQVTTGILSAGYLLKRGMTIFRLESVSPTFESMPIVVSGFLSDHLVGAMRCADPCLPVSWQEASSSYTTPWMLTWCNEHTEYIYSYPIGTKIWDEHRYYLCFWVGEIDRSWLRFFSGRKSIDKGVKDIPTMRKSTSKPRTMCCNCRCFKSYISQTQRGLFSLDKYEQIFDWLHKSNSDCQYTNTYKMAWAKSIIDLSILTTEYTYDNHGRIRFSLQEISKVFSLLLGSNHFFDGSRFKSE